MTDLITQFKAELKINTSEELFGITPQVLDQCNNIDSIIGTLNKTYKEIQYYVRTLNSIDDINDVARVAKDIDWESSNIIVDKELETLRSNIQLLRMWGQEWKDLAKSILNNDEDLVVEHLSSKALSNHMPYLKI
jgi:ABC-type phosphate transport system ATPase subunit